MFGGIASDCRLRLDAGDCGAKARFTVRVQLHEVRIDAAAAYATGHPTSIG
jgi:hypothetical protein